MTYHRLQINEHHIRVLEGETPTVMLQAGENCQLVVNGSRVSGTVDVGPADTIMWEGDKDTSLPFDLTVSSDQLTVLLTVTARHYLQWKPYVEQVGGSYVVHLREIENEEQPLTVDAIVDHYFARKFHVQPDKAAIEKAIKAAANKPTPIANGQPPEEGKNGYVEPHFSQDEEITLSEAADTINFRERRRIPVIRPGEVMATVHPPVQGKPGFDVWGKPLPPKPVQHAKYRLKHHVVEKNGKIYAQITGRPSMTSGANPTLEVVEVYTVPGNVDISTGNIRFSGDVIVLGDVTETMQVIAGQRLVVHGSIYNAEVRAGGSIHVDRTIQNSHVSAGVKGTCARRLLPLVNKLYKEANSIEQTRERLVKQARQRNQQLPFHRTLRLIIKDHFASFPKHIQDIQQYLNAHKTYLPDELKPLAEGINRFLHEMETALTQETWQALLAEVASCVHGKLEAMLEDESIVTQTADSSHLEVNGDIVFNGKGSTQSRCVASKRILFTRKDAACRGGHLEAGEEIIASHIGSFSGNKTTCRAGKRIVAHSIQNTEINVAGRIEYVERKTEIEYYAQDGMMLTRVREI